MEENSTKNTSQVTKENLYFTCRRTVNTRYYCLDTKDSLPPQDTQAHIHFYQARTAPSHRYFRHEQVADVSVGIQLTLSRIKILRFFRASLLRHSCEWHLQAWNIETCGQ